MNTSPHDVDDEFLVSQFKDVMPSVFFTVNEKINDHVGLVACCSSFYSFEINNIGIMQHILLFQINCFFSSLSYFGNTETDSDSSVDSNDNGNYLRYDSDHSHNNDLQELDIENNVNENIGLNVNWDIYILQKRKKTDICYFLFIKDWSLFCVSCLGICLANF